MMNCRILAVGSIKETYLKEGINEYLKRLKPVFPLTIAEVADMAVPQNAAEAQIRQAVEAEGRELLARLSPDALVVALAIKGKALSSEELAARLEEWSFSGRRELVFVIGGSYGLAEAVLQRADFRLSFGPATFPHQLMRLILTEQIYRAVKINRHEPYHK